MRLKCVCGQELIKAYYAEKNKYTYYCIRCQEAKDENGMEVKDEEKIL